MNLSFNRKEVLSIALSCAADQPGQVPYTGGSWEKITGEKARFERGLTLVGDHGVYWMSNSPNQKKVEGADSYPLAYAEECNPNKLSFDTWWSNKRASFGADDGVQYFPLKDINDWLSRNAKKKLIKIYIDEKEIRLL
jgi:hypothetical protein